MLKSTAFTAAKQANALPWVKKINSEWKGEIVSNISGSWIQPFPTVKKPANTGSSFKTEKECSALYAENMTLSIHKTKVRNSTQALHKI